MVTNASEKLNSEMINRVTFFYINDLSVLISLKNYHNKIISTFVIFTMRKISEI